MLGFVTKLPLPRYCKHFGSFPQNLLNGGVRYNNEHIIHQSLGTSLTHSLLEIAENRVLKLV